MKEQCSLIEFNALLKVSQDTHCVNLSPKLMARLSIDADQCE